MSDYTTLDLRGLKCPMPVLRTRKALRSMIAGSRVLVEATDPLSTIDIPNLCREDGHVLLEATQVGGLRRFLIERGNQGR